MAPCHGRDAVECGYGETALLARSSIGLRVVRVDGSPRRTSGPPRDTARDRPRPETISENLRVSAPCEVPRLARGRAPLGRRPHPSRG